MLLAILYLQHPGISNIYIAYFDIHYRNIIRSYNQTSLLPFSFDIRCVDSYNFYMRNIKMLSLIISCAVLAFSSVAVASDDTKAEEGSGNNKPVPARISVAKRTSTRIWINIRHSESAAQSNDVKGMQLHICDRKKSVNIKKSIVPSQKTYSFGNLYPYRTYYIRARYYSKENGKYIYYPWTGSLKANTKSAHRKQILRSMNAVSKKKAVRTFATDYRLKKSKAGRRLIAYTKKLQKRYRIRYIAVDLKSGEGFASGAKNFMYSASCLKGPYVAALCKHKPGSYKRSRGMMRSTIVVSNNDTYKSLRRRYGSSCMKKLMKYSGVSSFDYRRRYTYVPVRDLGKLWVGTYWYFYSEKNRRSKACRRMYTHGYQSFIYSAMKGRFKVHAKPGWYPGGGFNVQNDAGIIMAKVAGKKRPYALAVMTSACGRHIKLRKLVRLINKVHSDIARRSK